jgi:hypothetical protein
MPEETPKPPPQRRVERRTIQDSASEEIRINKGVAQDGEILEAAGGARPAPEPDSRPSGPINKAADLLEETRERAFLTDSLVESQTDAPPPPPPPPPPSDADNDQS